MNCFKTLKLIKESEVLHTQALAQIQKFCDTFFDMRPKGDLNIFTELRKINTEYERLKKQINENLKQIESLSNTQINTHYTHINPETKTEYQEDIDIDIEQQITEHVDFYKQTNIDLPPDFQETTLDIWNRNYSEIQSQIEQFGFNGVLIVPGNIPLGELSEKMKMEEGYYLGDDFKNVGGFEKCISTGTDKPRIILYHKKTLPEIHKQNGIDAYLSIEAEEAQKLYDKNPNKYLGDIEVLMIMMKKEGKHMFDHNNKSGVWLPATKQQGGRLFVSCYWDSDYSYLHVDAYNYGLAPSIGCRPSCYFI